MGPHLETPNYGVQLHQALTNANEYVLGGGEKAATTARSVALQNPIAANYEKGSGNMHNKRGSKVGFHGHPLR